MKKLILIAALAAFTSPLAIAGWLNHNEQQNGQITQLQGQLCQQQDETEHWQVIAVFLGVGCVITLVVGAAIGAKGRKASHGNPQ